MRFVVFGLTASSTWGNGHATLWRGLARSLGEQGTGSCSSSATGPGRRGVKRHHTSPPQQPEEFADFCARLVRRYG